MLKVEGVDLGLALAAAKSANPRRLLAAAPAPAPAPAAVNGFFMQNPTFGGEQGKLINIV